MAKLAILAVALLLLTGFVVGLDDSGSSSSVPSSPSPVTTTKAPPTKTTVAPKTTPKTTQKTSPKTSETTPKTSPKTTATTTSKTTPKSTPTTPPKSTPTTSPKSTPTTSPKSTPTTSPKSTPTTSPKSTPSTMTTPAKSTSPTSTAIPKTTTIPLEKDDYKIIDKDNKTICIMFAGSITFVVEYEAIDDKGKSVNKTANVTSPPHPQKGSEVSGTCDDNQYLSFDWVNQDGDSNEVTLNFTRAKDNKTWSLGSVEASLYIDPKVFVGAVEANKTLEITAYYTLDPNAVPVNGSYLCNPVVKTSNVTGTIDTEGYDLTLTSSMQNVQLQAYNKDPKQKNFASASSCPGDITTNDIIPIIVGCALGGLVIIVLVAYLVGRKRNNASNESTA